MMSNGYTVLPYRAEHAEAVAKLHRFLGTPDPEKNAAYLAWKYDRNPYLQWQHFYVAVHEGEVVGTSAYYGSLWEGGNATLVIPCGAEFVILPEHRGRGLFGAMLGFDDLAAHGHPIALSLSAVPKVAGGLRARGSVYVSSVGVFVRKSCVQKAVESTKSWIKAKFVRTETLRSIGARRRPTESLAGEAVPARAFTRFDERAASCASSLPCAVARTARAKAMAELVGRLAWDGRLRHRRDETYLAWRYENPLSDYRFLYAGNGSLDGYLVLQAPRYGKPGPVNIVDWEAATPTLQRHLLKVALALGDFRQIRAWSFGLSRDRPHTLAEFGFMPEPVGAHPQLSVMIKVLSDALGAPPLIGGNSLLDPSRWHYRMIFSDIC